MLVAPIDQHRHRPVVHIVEPPADEGKLLCGEIAHRRRVVDAAVEPRLHRVLIGGEHIGQVPRLQRTNMVGDQFGVRVRSRRQQQQSEDAAMAAPAPKVANGTSSRRRKPLGAGGAATAGSIRASSDRRSVSGAA